MTDKLLINGFWSLQLIYDILFKYGLFTDAASNRFYSVQR
jgi:hypothetical protein